MQKFEKLMLPITLVLIVVLGWIFFSSSSEHQSNGVKSSSIENMTETFSTKTAEMGAVMVEVTPINTSTYDISFNTHSVDLSFEFGDIIKLEDGSGEVYEPISWSGGRGGHHLRGEMVFSIVNPNAKLVKLTISGIENEVASFEWGAE